ncbi:biopolymer transport protein ExbB [Sphingomonas changbaiensis NBRC 104936]|uniref:Biopolymer transport protein ExbB n=1 Tax=Sphingomonas changbaiensis NBRC 104936 TaxID=1219043 RepID=A0A0E9MPP9_9SPHN|nr:MotA/TolQ/ExbB proton channel family protein [Sphingomonas changbaiensis]GAO39105.1 biopolymer transport protein ExbB [Sphingomonas changbaiensis NBRC 104936]
MITQIAFLQEAAAAAPKGENPYGLLPALQQGGVIAWSVFLILVFMSIFSFYILFTKLFEQQKIINQGRKMRSGFWNMTSLKEGANKLEKNSAYRQIVDDALIAQEQHGKLTDPVEAHDWIHGSINRSQGLINSKLGAGLAFLATVGATAPFIGLFGTVIGIYRALIKIGLAGQASIDAVAGPVGEALIMTALGLAVAVPAVLAYNWLQRRNKSIAEDLAAFSNDVLGYVMSGGSVKPSNLRPAGAPAAATTAKPAASTTKPVTGSTTAGQTGGVQNKA